MYQRILVPVENSSYDERILDHVRQLARYCGASIVLIHVADGWAARNIQHLNLRESEEMRDDRSYIERLATRLTAEGLSAEALLATGDPSAEIAAAAEREDCDLIAMLLKVDERRRDVAAMRLMGISRATVVRTVMLESSFVALLGSLFGVGLGFVVSAFVNAHYQAVYRTPLRFAIITPGTVTYSVLLSLVLGIAAGALAARRLARTPPLTLFGR